MKKVTIISYKKFMKLHPELETNFDDDFWSSFIVVIKGNKEYMLLCDDDELKTKIKSLPCDSYIGFKLKDIVNFLTKEKVEFEIDESLPTYL